MTNIKNDSYWENFTAGEYPALCDAQQELEKQTTWTNEVKKISILPLDTPMDVEVEMLDPANKISKEVLLDTAENCGLMISFDGQKECLRDCAMPSLMSTVEIRGVGVFRPEKTQQAILRFP